VWRLVPPKKLEVPPNKLGPDPPALNLRRYRVIPAKGVALGREPLLFAGNVKWSCCVTFRDLAPMTTWASAGEKERLGFLSPPEA
jgi:hypothetical protein